MGGWEVRGATQRGLLKPLFRARAGISASLYLRIDQLVDGREIRDDPVRWVGWAQAN